MTLLAQASTIVHNKQQSKRIAIPNDERMVGSKWVGLDVEDKIEHSPLAQSSSLNFGCTVSIAFQGLSLTPRKNSGPQAQLTNGACQRDWHGIANLALLLRCSQHLHRTTEA